MENKLTAKQLEVYFLIKKYIKEHNYPPSIRELCALCNVSSPATMFVHLKKMKKKGYIDYIERKSRTLQIIKGVSDDII